MVRLQVPDKVAALRIVCSSRRGERGLYRRPQCARRYSPSFSCTGPDEIQSSGTRVRLAIIPSRLTGFQFLGIGFP